MLDNRVVITGMGVVSPIGNDVDTFWKNLKNGVCGIKTLPDNMLVKDVNVHVAGLVTDLFIEKYLDMMAARRVARFSQFAIYAANEAMNQSGIEMCKEDVNRVGVMIGNALGATDLVEQESIVLNSKGAKYVSPLIIPLFIVNMAAGNVAIHIGAKGICTSITTACAAATHSIGEAFKALKDGRSNLMIAGGTEACITPLSIVGFDAIKALSTTQDPLRASIPFDKNRNGFVLGEGAGVLVMETLKHAKSRGAHIYAEIVGYGATGDAYHITSPEPSGEGAARAMNEALEEAGIQPKDIHYINAHGTSTYYNDLFETIAIKRVFGEDTKVAISSTKSMTGHLLGAAGGIEALTIVKAVIEDFIPPTIGYSTFDEKCNLDYVINTGRSTNVKYALSSSLGFGGHNAAIIMKKWEGD